MVELAEIRAPLFVPASRPERFSRAAASGTDAIILDLEDAVEAGAKEKARAALACSFTKLPVIVRVNAADTPWHEEDLAAVRALPVAAAMLPKSEDPGAVSQFQAKLGGQMPVIALVETARGLATAREIAAIDGVVRLAFGSIDYCADLGMAHTRKALLSARSELVLASRLGVLPPPLDGVTTSIRDMELVEDDARHASELGFGGKLCIHPGQVPVVKRAFAPSREQLQWAQRILATRDGVVSVDGEMVDAPVRARALALLAAAHADDGD